jgi:hypothetical protein
MRLNKKKVREMMAEMPDCFGYFGLGSEENNDDTCDKCSFGNRCVEIGNI